MFLSSLPFKKLCFCFDIPSVVTLKQDVDGHKIPLSIKWKNGTVYNVDKLSDVRHFSSVPTETETRYTFLRSDRS